MEEEADMFQIFHKSKVRTMDSAEKREFYKELLGLAVPIGMQNLLVALIGATDALMLGRLTQDAVAAVSLANQIVFIMNLFIGAVVGGGGSLIAQYWGKGDKTMVKNLFCMILKGAAAISFVFFALVMFIPNVLMRIYTPEPSLIGIGSRFVFNLWACRSAETRSKWISIFNGCGGTDWTCLVYNRISS